ncbi:uncharacterized protein LOC130919267 [Corythoichthys intestinalis]|uniref:uncharacterized protein LOC130919267 n=1 Tax=Corythoichthys intestinalis TaxID=161448 RepID=UPI0025A61C4D|nr:uncharacterized protein LOC130919267 [Corythoichthys intestinalis]
MALDSRRKELLLKTLMELGEDEFECFKFYTDLPKSVRENTRRVYIADQLVMKHCENTLHETVKILEKIGNNDLAQNLRSDMLKIEGAAFSLHDDNGQIARLKAELQGNLRSLYSFASEGNTERWQQQSLADVYTELDVTYGADVSPDKRHEVLQMETCATAKESILPCDIFKSPDGKQRPIRTLLTVGFAGIGKTFLVQKFVSDWASGNTNQDVDFIFPFTFREMNMDKGKRFTLAEFIRRYVCGSRHMSEETLKNIFDGLQTSGKRDYDSSGIKVLFVLDGLDECNFKIDLKNEMKVDVDVKEAYPLEVLLAHLIKGNLLPCARVWITTRPATAYDIPSDLIDSKTEVKGFSDSQRLEYFRKRFPNEERIIEYIRKSRTIFIMCHIPIFCWITAAVLQHYLENRKEGELPTTLTDMYSQFVFHHLEKFKERQPTKYIRYVKALAKLAFHHTMNKQQIFYEKDLVNSDLDYSQASKHCGLFTEVFKEVHPLRRHQQDKMFQFIHLTIQEYLAALYVMMSFFKYNENVLDDSGGLLKKMLKRFRQTTITEVHHSALKKASESEGNLDLFLRFLFGLSLPCNQERARELLEAPQDFGQSKSKTVELIQERIKQNPPEKNINLFYCLTELKDNSWLMQIRQEMNPKRPAWQQMSNDMWSALAFFLLTDDEAIEDFDLQEYYPMPLGLEKLLVVVKASQKSKLNNCNLDKRSCHLLASVLSSPSNLRHLDVNDNNLLDMGVEILSKGLASQNCVLKVLKLERCGITKQGCLSLAEALKLKPSSLRELHLSCNDLSDLGVEHLSKGLASPHCNLKVLGLRNCKITERGCISLAEAIKLNPTLLQELHLSWNNLLDVGVEILSKGLASPCCILQILELRNCKITERGCISLAKALKLNPSHLQKLHLSDNNLSDEGVMILSEGLASSHCKLKYLWLSYCRITKKGCISLAEVLKLNPSHLQELDLSYNDLLDEGFEIFCKGLANPHCILKVLRLSCCSITEKGCISLAEVLKINPSHLRKLDLSANNLSDKGVEILLNGLASPHCTLKVLRLENCRITQEGCISLAEVLKSEPSHLQELNLVGNQVGEAKRVLLDVQEDPNCNLKIVRRILLGQGTVRRLQDGVGATGKAASLTEFEAVCPPASRSFQQLYWEVDLNGKSLGRLTEKIKLPALHGSSDHGTRQTCSYLHASKCSLKLKGKALVPKFVQRLLLGSVVFGYDHAGNDNNSTALMPRRPASVTSLSQALEKTGRPLLSDASPRHLQGRMALDSKRRELLWNTLRNLGKNDFESFRFHTDLPESIRENTSREYIADELVKKHGENTLEETIKILKTIGNNNVAELLRTNMLKLQGPVFSDHDDDQIGRLKGHLQDNLKRLYSFAPECNTERWEQQPLADVYTDLDVTYGGDVSPDERHEVLQMETRAAAAKDSILPCDIFKSRDGKSRPIRTLLTVGFAGIGKTFLVQKFVLDWASGNTNLDVDFIFPFTFRELNMDKEESFNLAELIRRYVYESRDMSEDTLNNIFASLQTSGKRDYESSNIKILFVLDGLDECNFKMNLKNKAKVDLDVTKAYPLPVLLAYLIKKNLLPCARLWITTRPAAARDIPSNFIDSKTEVRGFSDSQRLEYFRKRFPSEERITKHIQKSRTIFIMCHMPIFCWLTATVLQDHLKKGKEGELPATLTNMYSAFVAQHLENSKERQTTEHIGYMKALAKLAFHHTMNNCQIFYEKDMVDSSFDYSQAAKHCGLFTEVFKEVHPLKSNKQKMFQFIHLTIQEYLAAVYVMMSLFHDNKNVLAGSKWSLKGFSMPSKQRMIIQVHKSALQKASESEGNLDLFLRFLLGLSLQCNQELVGELLTAPQDCGESKSKTVKLIKKRIKQNTPEKNINLFYCLNELKDDSLLEQIQQELVSKKLSWQKMPNDMWSALAFFLLTSDEAMNCFEMHKYSTSPLGLKKLLSVVKASQKSVLNSCGLDKHSCRLLASVLSSPSNLSYLDLGKNNLRDEGVEILSKGLASPHCILKVLSLSNCGMTTQGCFPLAEALELNHSNLQELDLSYNDLSDEGMDILFVGLVSQHCILESLKLLVCNITEGGCISLAKALKLNHSHLQELDLSSNSLSDKGVAILSKGLASPHCILKILRLFACNITKQGCISLVDALKLNPSHLQQLELSRNNLLDDGVKILLEGLASAHCILQVLKLERCGITEQGCVSLAEALELNHSHLQQLDLSQNKFSDEGVESLSDGLASPHCILKVLRLSCCGITKKGCLSLADALELNPSHLQQLDLSQNELSDEGVKILSKGLASPHSILKVLRLENCLITKIGCFSVAKLNPQRLDLSWNNLLDDGVKILLEGLASPRCNLQVLELRNCKITKQGCISLAKVLKLNSFHLQELKLGGNQIGQEGERVLLDLQKDTSFCLKSVSFEW